MRESEKSKENFGLLLSRYEDLELDDDAKMSQRQPAKAIGTLVIDNRECVKCKGPQAKVDPRSRSTVWYCGTCDVYEETTMNGAHLRFFLQKSTVVAVQGNDER